MDNDSYWNNIVVGDKGMNDSEQFFDRRREAMRLLKKELPPSKLAAAAVADDDDDNDNKENQSSNKTLGTTELLRLVEANKHKLAPQTLPMAKAVVSADNQPKSAHSSTTTTSSQPPSTNKPSSSQSSSNRSTPARTLRSASASRPKTNTATAPAPAAAAQFRRPAATTSSSSSSTRPTPVVPNAYRYQEIYERKHQRQAELQREEERKARECSARPMPNFSRAHRHLEDAHSKRTEQQQKITCPYTPRTLKTSLDAAEKRKLRQEEYLREKYAVVPCRAQPPVVLEQQPFRPRIVHREIETHPFKLDGLKRSRELRETRRQRNEELEVERRQAAEAQEERERRMQSEFRKMTLFKARPNPFA